MPKTYEPVGTPQTLGSAQASVTFNSISGAYTDLILIMGVQRSGSPADVQVRFNGDAGNTYSNTFFWGNGTSAGSNRESNVSYNTLDSYGYPPASPNFHTAIVQIMNYANTTTHKTFLSRANSANSGVDAIVGMWRNTAAITSLVLTLIAGGNMAIGSTFTLYGIKAA